MEFHLVIGWIGAFLFAICSIPQVIKTWHTKKADDLSWLFLIFWFIGEILTYIYILIDDILLGVAHLPLYVNYYFNIAFVLYLMYAKKVYR